MSMGMSMGENVAARVASGVVVPDERETTAPHQFTVNLPGPLDIAASLEPFRRSGDDLLDRWDGAWLLRILRVGQRIIPYACLSSGTLEAPALLVEVAHADDRAPVEVALRSTFMQAPAEYAALLRTDVVVAARLPGERGPAERVPARSPELRPRGPASNTGFLPRKTGLLSVMRIRRHVRPPGKVRPGIEPGGPSGPSLDTSTTCPVGPSLRRA
jgi:hypothetical protein